MADDILMVDSMAPNRNPLYDCIQETGPRTDKNETEPTQSVQDADKQRSTGTTDTATLMLLQYHIY